MHCGGGLTTRGLGGGVLDRLDSDACAPESTGSSFLGVRRDVLEGDRRLLKCLQSSARQVGRSPLTSKRRCVCALAVEAPVFVA